MKLARTIGTGLMTILVVMALGGVGSAMAETTALCAVDEDPCEAANQVTEVHFEAHNLTILSPLPEGEGGYNYGCDGLFSATVSELGKPQTLEAQSLSFTSCGQGCTRTTETLGTFSVLKVETELAEITANGFEIKVSCSGFSNCLYGFNEQVGTLKGALLAENGHITYQEAPLELISGFLCPKEIKLDALFEASEPIYVSS
ncbi:MAG: hypothetical protein ACM3N0_13350 [Chloroflexota bacterium]